MNTIDLYKFWIEIQPGALPVTPSPSITNKIDMALAAWIQNKNPYY